VGGSEQGGAGWDWCRLKCRFYETPKKAEGCLLNRSNQLLASRPSLNQTLQNNSRPIISFLNS
jgi:hypothetical protein